ncbi:hypothetical protein VNO77_17781 [Canavalia gladiata]|uniref:Uncharacterized protein n=1 Tax=Canavalia gladiata TaxID=3824 RepID=A0AAN9QN09_CANGL
MDSYKHIFPFLSLFLILLHLSGQRVLQAEAGPTKLFVFGDSYADTGNIPEGISSSWNVPYGVTFPGKPAGRFSDGRVSTDFFAPIDFVITKNSCACDAAKYLKLKSPIPYRLSEASREDVKYGVNFAFGGTGVFDTLVQGPNMTTQIDSLEQLTKDKIYSASDLAQSLALVSVAGNDYGHYTRRNGTLQGFPSFVGSVVNQIRRNLIRIKGLGVKKIVVGGIEPIGCLPSATSATSFQRCNTTSNGFALLHNRLLKQAVAKLNQESEDHSTFIVLDLYDIFISVLNNDPSKLKPCCVGVSSEYSCGSVDENNVKKYRLCDDPKSAFFWDNVHPTDAGWKTVYHNLQIKKPLQLIHY